MSTIKIIIYLRERNIFSNDYSERVKRIHSKIVYLIFLKQLFSLALMIARNSIAYVLSPLTNITRGPTTCTAEVSRSINIIIIIHIINHNSHIQVRVGFGKQFKIS